MNHMCGKNNMDLSNLVKRKSHRKKGKMAALQKSQNVVCPKPSKFVSSSYLFAKFGALDPSNNRNRCLEILDAAGALHTVIKQDISSIGTCFKLFLIYFFRLPRIVVDKRQFKT